MSHIYRDLLGFQKPNKSRYFIMTDFEFQIETSCCIVHLKILSRKTMAGYEQALIYLRSFKFRCIQIYKLVG